LTKGSCEKKIISIANSGKSPLSPLFQRGELAVERAELPNTHRAKLYLPSWIIPPLKKGDKKGDLNFFTASGDLGGFYSADDSKSPLFPFSKRGIAENGQRNSQRISETPHENP
jgi:hypothetical protein